MLKDWVEVELGDVFDFIGGGTPSKKESSYWNGKIPWASIKDIKGDYLLHTQDYITEDGLSNSSASLVFPDEIILATRINPGRPIISKIKTAINQDLKIVRPKISTDIKFIYYCFLNIERKILEFSSGTTVMGITLNSLKELTIPLAPLPEQRAIAAKIEQLFSELDNGIANLKTAKSKLEIYRQAILKQAFEGGLTKDWREKNNLPTAEVIFEQIKKERLNNYEKQLQELEKAVIEWEINGKDEKRPTRPSKPKILESLTEDEIEIYGKLPTGWQWSRFCNVTYKIGDIDHKMPKEVEEGLPYLSTGNLKNDGSIDFEGAKNISKADFDRLALKIKPQKGDIIFPRYGTIGRNILINFDKDFLVSYACAIIKNIPFLMNEKFVFYYSLSPIIKKEIKRYTVQTTQANIGIASIESFVFPLCSPQEQTQIVQEIETRLSVCDKLNEAIEQSLEKAQALRQSILKKAFEGKLLSEDELQNCRQQPDWEPAAKLLEKVKKDSKTKKS
jgi:type I restriction enzyme S subunit